jgi:hypothetical protein
MVEDRHKRAGSMPNSSTETVRILKLMPRIPRGTLNQEIQVFLTVLCSIAVENVKN